MNMYNHFLKMAQTYYHADREVGDVKEGKPLGTYFTDKREEAKHYGKDVQEAELKIQNTLRISGKDAIEDFDQFTTDEVNEILRRSGVEFRFPVSDYDEEFFRFLEWGGVKMKKALMKAGYDSIVYPEAQGYRKTYSTLVF